MRVTSEYLEARKEKLFLAGWKKPRWIEFCERMLDEGYEVSLREASSSVSKYITVRNGRRRFTVRYSNHGATRIKDDPCDFFVGKNHFGTTNTEQAIAATLAHLGGQ